jgi:hypothetical protein
MPLRRRAPPQPRLTRRRGRKTVAATTTGQRRTRPKLSPAAVELPGRHWPLTVSASRPSSTTSPATATTGLSTRWDAAHTWSGSELAARVRAPRSAGSHRPRASAIPQPSGTAPAARMRRDHVKAAREDRGEKHAGHRQGEDSRTAVRLRAERHATCSGRATKYPGKGVLHDLPSGDAGLRRT